MILSFRDLGAPGSVAIWFLGAIVAHDLVLLPLYSLAERIAARLTRATATPARAGAPSSPGALTLNHERVPAMIAGLLFLLFFSSILGRNEGYAAASGTGHRRLPRTLADADWRPVRAFRPAVRGAARTLASGVSGGPVDDVASAGRVRRPIRSGRAPGRRSAGDGCRGGKRGAGADARRVPLLDGCELDEMVAFAQGQALAPWPNRLADGR